MNNDIPILRPKILPPKVDVVFKLLFGDERNKETGITFTDVMEINTLELQKIPEESDNTAKYDWLRFLKAEREEEFDMLAERSAVVKKAVVELKRLSADEEAQRLYEAREMALRDEQSRLRTAINKRNIQIVEKMIKRGDSLDDIANVLELPFEEIKIINNNFIGD